MKKISRFLLHSLFRRELDIRVKIFHVLAIAGVLICVAMTILSISIDMSVSAGINMAAGAFSLFLLIYSVRGGPQQVCYAGTVIVIFLVLFPGLFLFGGGYQSGMVFFFVFAVVYTVYLLDGWKMIAFVVFELFYYSGFCIGSYLYPEYVHQLESEQDILTDTVVGFLVVSISLGITMFVQFRMYQKQQKELEQARAGAESANQAKSAFLANMSHEIRTPIHVILGVNELLSRETRDPEIRKYTEKIRSAGEVLQSLVDHVLDMSRIEAGKTELHSDVYRTDDLMNVLELTGQTRCEAKNLRFHCIRRSLPEHLYGDAAHIQQIGINLLSNAVKYTKTGSVTLSVCCRQGDSSGQVQLCIAVTDTGIGIREEDLPGLFEPFSRVESDAGRGIEGTGLGLSIVKALCSLMSGSIRVESRYGWGSTFTAELPQLLPDDRSLTGQEPMHTFYAPEGQVLVVDDHEENLEILKKLLEHTGLVVDTASSGTEAVEMARRKSYHVILLDYMMPGMDGVETLKQLKALPGFSVPVIALTANVMAGTREQLLEAGFTSYLTKPVPWNQLEQRMMEYLPKELVTLVPSEAAKEREARELSGRLGTVLQDGGIDLSLALPYFDGSLQQYAGTAALFLRYYRQDKEKLEDLQTARDPSGLIYCVHSLKGRAKNLGLAELSAEAEHMERLCGNQNTREAQSLIPHLLYLYARALPALERLTGEIQAMEQQPQTTELPGAPADCSQELFGLLDEHRRRPSLACIDALLQADPSQRERELLSGMRAAVEGIDFEKALQLFAEYLKGEEIHGLPKQDSGGRR